MNEDRIGVEVVVQVLNSVGQVSNDLEGLPQGDATLALVRFCQQVLQRPAVQALHHEKWAALVEPRPVYVDNIGVATS